MATALLIVTYVVLGAFFVRKQLEKRRISVNSLTSVNFYQNTASLEHETDMLPHIDSRVADSCVTCKEEAIADSYLTFARTVNEIRQLKSDHGNEFAPGGMRHELCSSELPIVLDSDVKFITLAEAQHKGYPPSATG